LSGGGTLWYCAPHVCRGGTGIAGGGVPLGAVPVLSWYGEVSLGGTASSSYLPNEVFERFRSKSSPLEQTRLKLANPVELTGFDRG